MTNLWLNYCHISVFFFSRYMFIVIDWIARKEEKQHETHLNLLIHTDRHGLMYFFF